MQKQLAGARKAISTCAQVKTNETVVIVTDPELVAQQSRWPWLRQKPACNSSFTRRQTCCCCE